MKGLELKNRLDAIKRKIIAFFASIKNMILARDNKVSLYAIFMLFSFLIAFLLVFVILQNLSDSSFGEQSPKTQEKPIAHDPQVAPSKASITSKDAFYAQPEGDLSILIRRANILYDNGRIDEALEIFGDVALYSQSLAYYNLGVIQIQEKHFKDAIGIFEKAIEGGDVALSSINAAYSALRIGDMEKFERFLKLADLTLIDSINTPFYSYLYGLASYYKNQYFESLSPFLHPNSSNYLAQSNAMASEIFLMLGDDYNALEYLKKDNSMQNALALGMLYARNGDYLNAREKMQEYLHAFPDDLEALSALELVELKMGNFQESTLILQALEEKKKKPSFDLKVGLNSDLFDIHLAQKDFWNRRFERSKSLQYKILFYYAPYRVFDSQKVFQFLAEGGFDVRTGSIDEAKDSYARGRIASRINRNIAMGLQEVYAGDLRKALKIFLRNAETYSQDSILFYNVGLLYAQLGDFENAYHYFSRAYYLNSKDLLSGIFTIMTGRLIYQDTSRVSESITDDFSKNTEFESEDEKNFLNQLFHYANTEKIESFQLLQENSFKPIHYALEIIFSVERNNYEKIDDLFLKLRMKYPDDLVTNMLYQVTKNFGGNIKEISLDFSNLFRRGNFSNMHSLYYGGSLARELYVYLAFVTGNLAYAIGHLEERLINEENSLIGTMQALGLSYIYNQEFEKGFSVYNTLIDSLGEKDARTKFLGAVAAIGAGHYNNAVALLQISKLESIATLESRYALALLYQQTGNLRSAITLFQSIADKGFTSEFFDFSINTSEILKKAQE